VPYLASAVVFHYEGGRYQVYAPLRFSYMIFVYTVNYYFIFITAVLATTLLFCVIAHRYRCVFVFTEQYEQRYTVYGRERTL